MYSVVRISSMGSFILLKYYFHLLINDFNITKKIKKHLSSSQCCHDIISLCCCQKPAQNITTLKNKTHISTSYNILQRSFKHFYYIKDQLHTLEFPWNSFMYISFTPIALSLLDGTYDHNDNILQLYRRKEFQYLLVFWYLLIINSTTRLRYCLPINKCTSIVFHNLHILTTYYKQCS